MMNDHDDDDALRSTDVRLSHLEPQHTLLITGSFVKTCSHRRSHGFVLGCTVLDLSNVSWGSNGGAKGADGVRCGEGFPPPGVWVEASF